MHIFQHGPCRFWTFVVATPEVVVVIQWVFNVAMCPNVQDPLEDLPIPYPSLCGSPLFH